jgi:hypothetical protein
MTAGHRRMKEQTDKNTDRLRNIWMIGQMDGLTDQCKTDS